MATAPTAIAPNAGSISADAMQYAGTRYVYGGANPNGWDCSGFVNWVLGHDLGMTLPGATKPGFSGKTHGPVVLSYSTWSAASTVAKPEAGDLCIWVGAGPSGHIGIATGPGNMISALNPALGTVETPIQGQGPSGAPLIYRRLGVQGGTGCLPLTGAMISLLRLYSILRYS